MYRHNNSLLLEFQVPTYIVMGQVPTYIVMGQVLPTYIVMGQVLYSNGSSFSQSRKKYMNEAI